MRFRGARLKTFRRVVAAAYFLRRGLYDRRGIKQRKACEKGCFLDDCVACADGRTSKRENS